ncbi:MAG: ATP synthase F0 subunit B [Deltaproteobacteria bacterium]|nr:ATP synthase F0 subunit B [Deltaproteobacteria bacterium]
MARVIKAGQGVPKHRPSRVPLGGNKKVIEKEVYKARQEAADFIGEAEGERDAIIAEGKARASQAHEEALHEGAEEAFSEAAKEALAAFRSRANRYAEAEDDIAILSLELAKKVLGRELSLGDDDLKEILREGMHTLCAKRTLRIQLPVERAVLLQNERPLLMNALDNEPDLVLLDVTDVNPGFARVVIEAGAALCTEQEALDLLAGALDIEERAIAPVPVALPADDAESLLVQDALPDTREANAKELEIGAAFNAGHFADDDEETLALLHTQERALRKQKETTGVHAVGSSSSMIRTGTGVAVLKEKKGGAPKDIESTMALDVSQLRSEWADDESSTGEGLPEE